MAELWDFIAPAVKGLYCRVAGHAWLNLPEHGVVLSRICLRCLTRQWRDSDGQA
jgi:hypothetical protein